MPFWKRHKDRPSKGEIESMQDAKISLAENLPAHTTIVDISKIYLEHIPYGVLSVIKHQNKECLIAKENDLKDFKGINMDLLDELLKLDLSYNIFRSIPKEISHLSSLIHLNFDHNHLTNLPSALGALENLEYLSARSNEIKTVAPEVGHLKKLKTLNLTSNEIQRLPDSFAYCISLVNIEMDLEKVVYPTGDVINQGGRALVIWLCEENNIEKPSFDNADTDTEARLKGISEEEKNAQEMVLKHQQIMDEEQAELMKHLQEEEDRFKEIASKENEKEERNLKRLRKRLEDEDEEEHKKISDYLRFQDDVKNANIQEALKDLEEKEYDATLLLAEIEKMKAEEKENLRKYLEEDEVVLKKYMGENELDLSYISQEMQKVLEEDRMMASFVKGAEKELQLMFKNVQEQDFIDSNMAKTMQNEFEKDSANLMKLIMEDEDLQKKMFITAQQEHDKIYQALNQEIESLQENLMLLTILEKSQKDIDEQALAHITSQRSELATMLTTLMSKQEERRIELEETAKLIEEQHEDELANFWLYQYQMLMDSKPAKIRKEEDEAVKAAIKAAQIEGEYGGKGTGSYPTPSVLPAAWRCDGPSAPPPELASSVSEQLPPAWSDGPSAPMEDAPSAPPESTLSPTDAPQPVQKNVQKVIEAESECCICLDKAPNLAFLPCGHVCCCVECGIVSLCPMCRAEVTGRIQLFFTQT